VENRKILFIRNINLEIFDLDPDKTFWTKSTFMDLEHGIILKMKIHAEKREVIDADAEMIRVPYSICPMALEKVKNLVGLKIERGVMKEITRRVGHSDGCVHIRELTMETVNLVAGALMGYSAGFGLMDRNWNKLSEKERLEKSMHVLQNTCYPYRQNPDK